MGRWKVFSAFGQSVVAQIEHNPFKNEDEMNKDSSTFSQAPETLFPTIMQPHTFLCSTIMTQKKGASISGNGYNHCSSSRSSLDHGYLQRTVLSNAAYIAFMVTCFSFLKRSGIACSTICSGNSLGIGGTVTSTAQTPIEG